MSAPLTSKQRLGKAIFSRLPITHFLFGQSRLEVNACVMSLSTHHQWEEHRWGYDFETLAHRLTRGGFARVKELAFRHSTHDPALAEWDREVHAPYSLYVDAIK